MLRICFFSEVPWGIEVRSVSKTYFRHWASSRRVEFCMTKRRTEVSLGRLQQDPQIKSCIIMDILSMVITKITWKRHRKCDQVLIHGARKTEGLETQKLDAFLPSIVWMFTRWGDRKKLCGFMQWAASVCLKGLMVKHCASSSLGHFWLSPACVAMCCQVFAKGSQTSGTSDEKIPWTIGRPWSTLRSLEQQILL